MLIFVACLKPLTKKRVYGGFPGRPVAKNLHSQCREPGFHVWSGN